MSIFLAILKSDARELILTHQLMFALSVRGSHFIYSSRKWLTPYCLIIKQRPIDQAFSEILEFKSLVERQTYKDIFVSKQPHENIARALVQTHLRGRSYREIPVRGGQSDILVFDSQGRFLYETKIWRGNQYFLQGIREIEEYIIGENSDQQLTGVFYVLFDPTKSAAARRYRGSDLTREIVANRTVHVIVVNINPPKPSKKRR